MNKNGKKESVTLSLSTGLSQLLIFLFVLISCIACDETTPPPPPPEDKEPVDPFELTWTIDTLSTPGTIQTLMTSIYVADKENDIYVCGHDPVREGIMWHYDGNGWTTVDMSNLSGYRSLTEMIGFGPNDIWAVGETSILSGDVSCVLHYDGSKWEYSLRGLGDMLQSVWGSSSDDIWAGGVNTLLHYNGTEWSKVDIPMPPQGIQITRITGFSSDEVYFAGISNDFDYKYMYKYNGSEWAITDTSLYGPGQIFGSQYQVIENKLYSVGGYIYEYTNNTWSKVNDDFKGLTFFYGYKADYIFAAANGDRVFYYNGQSYKEFTELNYTIKDLWTDGEDVIFLGQDYRSFIIWGKK